MVGFIDDDPAKHGRTIHGVKVLGGRAALKQAVADNSVELIILAISNASGETGYFQLQAKVYDRAGLPCRECGAPIKTIRQGQRSTFYCPKCQKP